MAQDTGDSYLVNQNLLTPDGKNVQIYDDDEENQEQQREEMKKANEPKSRFGRFIKSTGLTENIHRSY